MANEKRLISADVLVRDINADPYRTESEKSYDRCLVHRQPTVDAVPVVRCKDCKHWHEETGWCTKHSHFIGFDGMACHPSQSSEWKMLNADDFCSYGERRTDGETETT